MKRFGALIIIILAVGFMTVSTKQVSANPYADWQYKVPITITNNLVDVLTDFQVKIILNSTNFNWNHVRSDGADIRFTDASGNPIPYWIESWDYTNQHAVVWVKVPEIPSSSSTTIYMYYGNGAATSESNGDAVFLFFDDFTGTSLNTTKWTVLLNQGTISVSNSILDLSRPQGGYGIKLESNTTFSGENLLLEAKQEITRTSYYYWHSIAVGNGTIWTSMGFVIYKYYESAIYTGTESHPPRTSSSSSTDGDIIPNPTGQVWQVVQLAIPKDNYLKFRYDNGSWTTSTRYMGIGGSNLRIEIIAYSAGGAAAETLFDWIRVRKYAARDPAVTIGAEELNDYRTLTFSFSDSLGNAVNGVSVYNGTTFLGVFNNSDSISLETGNYTLTFKKDGYQDVTKTVELVNDTTLSVVFVPTNPITLTLNFKDDLSNTLNNVNVSVNSRALGTFNSGDSIILATPGNYTIVAQKNHYISVQQTFNIQNDTTVILTLNRESYLVYFYAYDYNNTELNTFDVYANGTKLGTFSSGGSTLLKYGTYTFKFVKNGYRSVALPEIYVNESGIKVTFTNIMPNNIYALSFYFYNAENNTEVNNVTVTVNNEAHTLNSGDEITLFGGNYTLMFTKDGYESKTLTLEVTNDISISIYLVPSNLAQEQHTYNLTNTPGNGTISLPSDYGFKGAKLGELFVQGKWSDVYTQFWHYDPLASIILPLLFSVGLILAGFIYTRNPLVPIAVTAVMMTFFHLLGLSLNISLITPLAGLFVFFMVWALWDFYKRFERS